LQLPANSREIQNYYSAVTMKSNGDISADLVRKALQTTTRGPNPARRAFHPSHEEILSKMKK